MSRERKTQAAAAVAIVVILIGALFGRDLIFGRSATADGGTNSSATPSLRRVIVRTPERGRFSG